jgi:hypothetical protein
VLVFKLVAFEGTTHCTEVSLIYVADVYSTVDPDVNLQVDVLVKYEPVTVITVPGPATS